ncbi:hypothetical protein A2U01_0075696 [Trifolium medium]|uniref:Uncharacterized protein n=1 Tax=Trifolium medium TaxID=97028 RepID=A0A392T2R4_9FABA|nr:hypothetical protein [Trifolium medium]
MSTCAPSALRCRGAPARFKWAYTALA